MSRLGTVPTRAPNRIMRNESGLGEGQKGNSFQIRMYPVFLFDLSWSFKIPWLASVCVIRENKHKSRREQEYDGTVMPQLAYMFKGCCLKALHSIWFNSRGRMVVIFSVA